MTRPVIGIVANEASDPAFFGGLPFLRLPRTYADAVTAAGGVPVVLPLTERHEVIEPTLDLLDGVILSGGQDVAGRYFGQEHHRLANPPLALRDEYELAALPLVLERGLPVLGICRGCQVLNVYFGGTLHQDQTLRPGTGQHDGTGAPDEPLHEVTLSPSRLRDWSGADRFAVNSLHHQLIDRVAPGLDVVATAPDGVVEAFERSGGGPFIGAVQWHPEVLAGTDPRAAGLFRGFVASCGTAASAAAPA